MNFIRETSVFLLIYLLSLPLIAQEYLFDAKLYTTEDGLANLRTTAIHKDQKGFLWVATKYGLNRFDGVNFELFTKETNGLQNNARVQSIREDDQGFLWLTYILNEDVVGIDIFNPNTLKSTPFETVFENKLPFRIIDLIINKSNDKNKRLWFSTKKGQLFSYENGQFIKQIDSLEFAVSVINATSDENIWFASNNQLLRYSPIGKIDTILTVPHKIYEFWSAENNQIWLTTRKKSKGLAIFSIWRVNQNGENLRPFTLTKGGRKLTQFKKIARNSKGFWFVTIKDRLQLFSPKGELMYDFHDLLTEEMKTGFFQHYENGQQNWFATPLGLIKTEVKRNPFQLIYQRKELADCRNIIEAKDSVIYFLDSKIHQWKPKENTLKKMTDYPSNIGFIYTDSIFWTGSYGGTNIGVQFDLKTGEKTTHYSLTSNMTYHTLPTQQAYRYLAGQHQGLGFIDLKEKKYTPFEKYNDFEQLKEAIVYFLHKNKEGVWLATNLGIFLLEEGEGITKHFHKDNGDLPFNHVRHIYEDKEGDFWLATNGGGIIKWQYKNGKVRDYKQLTTKDGLSNNYIYGIYGDDYGKLWASSDKGLMRLDKANYNVRIFLKADGLAHNEFNTTAHLKAKDGTMYFGGLGGLISFHPSTFVNSIGNKTPMTFTRFSLLEADTEGLTDKTDLIKQNSQVIVRPNDKFIELEFSLLDFDDPSQHTYAYQIEGYSNQWNYIDENYLRITSLPYGNYRLKIKGRNFGKGWSSDELFLDIQVEKPFYLQTWFITLSILSLLSLIAGSINWRLQSLQKDRERLESEVEKRTTTIQQQAEKLQALDKAKTRFFSNITHEFRTPLTLVIGPLEQVMKAELPEKPKSKLTSVLKNARHLLGLINQLLDLSKLESGKMKVEVTHGDLITYTQSLYNDIKPLAEKKEQSFLFFAPELPWKTQFDKKKWNKIIYNLLSNAIKYTPENGHIQIEIIPTKLADLDWIHLRVKDDGVGIKKNQLDQIFNRFYQADDSSTRYQEGTGIGLALVKELVELQGGIIEVSSEYQKGTTFDIKLPIPESAQLIEMEALPLSTREKLIHLTPSDPKTTIATAINQPQDKEQLEILIIEDNTEIRAYIRDCLEETKYYIPEASNGIEGIEKAVTTIPDLIISDVMMPDKDGFEVTATLRSNISTSHIPIILLTAKSALESRIHGFKSGADVYLTKPFSPKELRIRIQKLIELRELIRNSIQAPKVVDIQQPSEKEKKQPYEKENNFLKEVRVIIAQNINEAALNGEFIGKQIGLSRMQVHRKMKALINQSASELIKEIRLQKAYELLQTQNYNSSEVAYQTGFNTLAYFSKSFKDKFGYPPSEIGKTIPPQ